MISSNVLNDFQNSVTGTLHLNLWLLAMSDLAVNLQRDDCEDPIDHHTLKVLVTLPLECSKADINISQG